MSMLPCSRALLIQALIVASFLHESIASLPSWSWDTVQRFAHCSNTSGLLAPAVAEYLASLPVVTFEKWQGVSAAPAADAAEDKIKAVGAQIKAINASTHVFMYYQTDWARTWYTSGRWFDAHPELEVKDASGKLVVGGGQNWHLYDFAQAQTREMYVEILANITESPEIDGVFIDGFRDGQYVCLSGCAPDEKTRWVAGLNQTVHMLRAAVGDDTAIITNGASQPAGGASGFMIEVFNPKSDLRGSVRALSSHPGMIVMAHCSSCGNDADFVISLAAFLVGMTRGSYLAWGGWMDCASYMQNGKYAEFNYPLGEPTGPAQVTAGTFTRSFASGTNVSIVDGAPPKACIRWSNGKSTGCPNEALISV